MQLHNHFVSAQLCCINTLVLNILHRIRKPLMLKFQFARIKYHCSFLQIREPDECIKPLYWMECTVGQASPHDSNMNNTNPLTKGCCGCHL